jgi:hypothetical protein
MIQAYVENVVESSEIDLPAPTETNSIIRSAFGVHTDLRDWCPSHFLNIDMRLEFEWL